MWFTGVRAGVYFSCLTISLPFGCFCYSDTSITRNQTVRKFGNKSEHFKRSDRCKSFKLELFTPNRDDYLTTAHQSLYKLFTNLIPCRFSVINKKILQGIFFCSLYCVKWIKHKLVQQGCCDAPLRLDFCGWQILSLVVALNF